MRSGRSLVRPSTIVGLALVAFGSFLTLDNLGLMPDLSGLVDYWPVVLILLGLSNLTAGARARGLLMLALGTAFLLPKLVPGITWEDIWDHWPLMLVGLGVYLLVGGSSRRRGTPTVETPFVSAFGFLATIRRRLQTLAFEGGDLAAFLGACEIDLGECEVAEGGAVIRVFAFWGGIELRIPRHWGLDLRVTPLMGGADDRTQQDPEPGAPLVVVTGFVMMGGIDVVN